MPHRYVGLNAKNAIHSVNVSIFHEEKFHLNENFAQIRITGYQLKNPYYNEIYSVSISHIEMRFIP